MRVSRVLNSAVNLTHTKMTLFTRANCSLCDNAKLVVQKVRNADGENKPHYIWEYNEVDIMKSGNEVWKQAYEFDVPVLHVYAKKENDPEPDRMDDAKKLMHRFTEKEVQDLVRQTSEDNLPVQNRPD